MMTKTPDDLWSEERARIPDAFSNGDAMDFLDVMFGNPTWDVARDAFASVVKFPNELDYTDGAYALVAVALIANSRTGAPPVPVSVTSLVTQLGKPPQDIVEMARKVLPVVIESQARFAEQHLPRDVCTAWRAYVAGLQSTLEQGNS